jgi:hypothetical protein
VHAIEIYNHNMAAGAGPDHAHGMYMLDGLLEMGYRVTVNAGAMRTSAIPWTASEVGLRFTVTASTPTAYSDLLNPGPTFRHRDRRCDG